MEITKVPNPEKKKLTFGMLETQDTFRWVNDKSTDDIYVKTWDDSYFRFNDACHLDPEEFSRNDEEVVLIEVKTTWYDKE